MHSLGPDSSHAVLLEIIFKIQFQGEVFAAIKHARCGGNREHNSLPASARAAGVGNAPWGTILELWPINRSRVNGEHGLNEVYG